MATFLAYILIAVTFDPLAQYMGRNPQPSPTAIAAKKVELNLNGNPITRYFHWISGVIFHGNFGITNSGQPVTAQLWTRIGISTRLVIPGTIIGILLGLFIGTLSAIKQYKPFDYISTIVTFVLLSTPALVLAPLLKWVAVSINQASNKNIFLYTGETSSSNNARWWELYNLSNFGDRLQHIIIPTFVLLLLVYGSFSRYMRGSMLDELNQSYIRTAQAKGLTKSKAIMFHAFRTALIPLTTMFAFTMGSVITGATFTETMFGWHGIGEWIIVGITTQDINITATVVLLSGIVVVFSRILADFLTSLLDPRVRGE